MTTSDLKVIMTEEPRNRSSVRDRRGGGSKIVRLELVDPANTEAVLALELDPKQEDFLADNASSLEEACENEDAHPRAIVAGDRVIGFLMYDASDDDTEAVLYRFMIDRREQGRGYGRLALAAMLDEIRVRADLREVRVCYMPDNKVARRLYAKAGFVEEGLDEDGEMIACLTLAALGYRP